jgi:hypothetical protein
MLTHAQLAARLLRDAASFFRHLADENPTLHDSMAENALIYDQVADMVEESPTMTIEMDEAK